MGLETYGLWSFVMAIISIFTLAEGGLSLSITVFVVRDLSGDRPRGVIETITITLSLIFTLASLATIAILLSAHALSGLLPNILPEQRDKLGYTLALSAPVIWARLHQQALIGLKQAYHRFGLINILQTTQTAVLTVGWLLIAWRQRDIVALMIWQVLVTLSFLVLHIIYGVRLLRGIDLRPTWTRSKANCIVRYSLTNWLGMLGAALFSHADRLIIGTILGSSGLGFYATITSVTSQINTLSSMFIQPQLPIITQMFTNLTANLLQLRERVRQAIAMNTFGSLGIGTVLLAGSNPILRSLVSGVNIEMLTAFRILIVIYSLYSLNAVGTYILIGANQTKKNSLLIICCGLATLGLIAFGARSFGITGAITGNVGYIGTLAVYWFSMQQISLAHWKWLGWIYLPLGIFLCGSVMTILLPHLVDPFLIGTFQICILSVWFALNHWSVVQHMLYRLFLGRS